MCLLLLLLSLRRETQTAPGEEEKEEERIPWILRTHNRRLGTHITIHPNLRLLSVEVTENPIRRNITATAFVVNPGESGSIWEHTELRRLQMHSLEHTRHTLENSI